MTHNPSDRFSSGRLYPVAIGPNGEQRALDKYDGPAFMANQGAVTFHAMAKPAGAACNLNCSYCFYLSKSTLPGKPGSGLMSDDTLEAFIRQYCEGVTAPEVVFTWQGGEPTLRGLDFFKKVVALQKQYARAGQRVENDLQTNGVLLNDEWCAFLKEHRFLVGISIDGPRDFHDRFRIDSSGKGTFERVMAAIRLLQKTKVPFSTLTCVGRHNARKPMDIYRFLRDEVGSKRMQFTPIVEFQGFEEGSIQSVSHRHGAVTDWSVDPDDWGYFLCRLFDRWSSRDVGKIFVNQFETMIARRMGEPAQICVYAENCGKGVAVEHDGRVYSCDHYVYPDFQIGSIHEQPLRDLVLSRGQVRFGYAKSETLPRQCLNCEFLPDCRGECPKNRIACTGDGEPGLNYLCRGFQTFFAHASRSMDQIAASAIDRRRSSE